MLEKSCVDCHNNTNEKDMIDKNWLKKINKGRKKEINEDTM